MKNHIFFVEAMWDKDAGVFCSKSNIVGLHIEAKTIKEFKKVMKANAADLVIANHFEFRNPGKSEIPDSSRVISV